MSKRLKYWLIGGLISVFIVLGSFAGGFFTARDYYLTEELKTVKFILDSYHNYYYYESGDVPHLMVDEIMDQYSQYYTKEEYELIVKSAQGYRKAIGVGFADENSLEIVSVLFNSPAEKAGIKVGGKITKINGIAVKNQAEFKPLAVGAFSLSIDYGEGEVLYENIEAQEFKETYVKYYDGQKEYSFGGDNISLIEKDMTSVDGQTIPNDTLYVKFSAFNGTASGSVASWDNNINTACGQFNNAMQFFKTNDKSKIILDLRGNGGGYLSILTGIASHFVSSLQTTTPLVLYSQNKHGVVDGNYYSQITKKSSYNFQKIIILADKNSASASEALIGAILDYDEDNLVSVVVENNNGVYTTYGKGIMQDTIMNKSTGEAIKLTVAEIYWPTSGICIHGKGVSKAISLYSDKIYESKDASQNPISAFNYAINNLI